MLGPIRPFFKIKFIKAPVQASSPPKQERPATGRQREALTWTSSRGVVIHAIPPRLHVHPPGPGGQPRPSTSSPACPTRQRPTSPLSAAPARLPRTTGRGLHAARANREKGDGDSRASQLKKEGSISYRHQAPTRGGEGGRNRPRPQRQGRGQGISEREARVGGRGSDRRSAPHADRLQPPRAALRRAAAPQAAAPSSAAPAVRRGGGRAAEEGGRGGRRLRVALRRAPRAGEARTWTLQGEPTNRRRLACLGRIARTASLHFPPNWNSTSPVAVVGYSCGYYWIPTS
jgi:hypothetical protein